MSFADTPAPHGATKINFRQTTPYVYQKYPSTRNHPDGRSVEVKNAEEDAALGPEWRDTPYPQKPIAAPVPEPTFDELKAEHLRLVDAIEALRLGMHALQTENADLKIAVQQMSQQAEATTTKKSNKQAKPEAAA